MAFWSPSLSFGTLRDLVETVVASHPWCDSVRVVLWKDREVWGGAVHLQS